jgi:hypothetical protein
VGGATIKRLWAISKGELLATMALSYKSTADELAALYGIE